MPTTKLLSDSGKRFPNGCPLARKTPVNRQMAGYGNDTRQLGLPASLHQSEPCDQSDSVSAILNGDFEPPTMDGMQSSSFVVVRSDNHCGSQQQQYDPCNSLQSNGIQNGSRMNSQFSDASSSLPNMWFPSSSSAFDQVYSSVDDGGGSKAGVIGAFNGYGQPDNQLGMDPANYHQMMSSQGPFNFADATQLHGGAPIGERQCRQDAANPMGGTLRPSDLMLLLMLNQQNSSPAAGSQQHYGKGQSYGAMPEPPVFDPFAQMRPSRPDLSNSFIDPEHSLRYLANRRDALCAPVPKGGAQGRNVDSCLRRSAQSNAYRRCMPPSQPFDMSSIENALDSAFGAGSLAHCEFNRLAEADETSFLLNKPHHSASSEAAPQRFSPSAAALNCLDQPVHPNDIAFLRSLSAYCQRQNRCPTPPADVIFRDAMNTFGPNNSAWACESIMSTQLPSNDLCSAANPQNSLALAGHALSLISNVCQTSGQAGFSDERYSRKVFVGGLPPDIDEGYAFLIYSDERSVQDLIEACVLEDQKLYMCVSSPSIKDKPVQIRPWLLSDSDYVMDGSQPLDPRKTIFVGGVPRPLRAVELALIMNRVYGGVCYAGIDTDPELKYPKGAGRVAFSNQQSYITAISARFMQLRHGDIDKRVEVKPYVLDDQMCDECRGARCNGKFAPFFCANVACLQYYCENCWTAIHCRAGREFHKPLVKEGSDRPRGLPYRWA